MDTLDTVFEFHQEVFILTTVHGGYTWKHPSHYTNKIYRVLYPANSHNVVESMCLGLSLPNKVDSQLRDIYDDTDSH